MNTPTREEIHDALCRRIMGAVEGENACSGMEVKNLVDALYTLEWRPKAEENIPDISKLIVSFENTEGCEE